MLISSQLQEARDLNSRLAALSSALDCEAKRARLAEVVEALADPAVWQELERSRELGRERSALEAALNSIDGLHTRLEEASGLLQMVADEDGDEEDSEEGVLLDIQQLLQGCAHDLDRLEFQRLFNRPEHANNAFVDIQAGSGGTEAQDWAQMLLRMYLRWGERRQYRTELMEASPGEVAGIKSATILFSGDHAYGWLRSETGVHRLVRKSPFDSGHRRHTSFAAVFVAPEIDDKIKIEINPADLRIDVYRASGAGGQHVNRTESAVRITHLPTNTVIQCQSDRSQHRNKATAMKQLSSRLYEMELRTKQQNQKALEGEKSNISWGSQIRSYVLDQSRIKDLRTGVEVSDTQRVLDGDLDPFLESALRAQS